MLRLVLRPVANGGASEVASRAANRVASFGDNIVVTQQMRPCEPANFPSDIFP
jgi:hypothetical protein